METLHLPEDAKPVRISWGHISSDKKELLRHGIAATDRQIDALVYELSLSGMIYGLSPEEIDIAKRGRVATCGTCCSPRGLGVEDLTGGVEMCSMDLLGDWTMEADQVIVY
jgi:hypothetical protein